jgi:hypothetical protein
MILVKTQVIAVMMFLTIPHDAHAQQSAPIVLPEIQVTASAHITVKLPDTIIGDWCISQWGNDQNHNQQIFTRTPPDGCHVADGGLGIDQEGTEGGELGRCTFDKIEQIGPNAFLVYEKQCDNEAGNGGPKMLEIVDGKLVITFPPEG